METNNNELVTIHEVKNTPFCVVENNGKFHVVVGNKLASKKEFESIEAATDYIKKKPYELLCNLIGVMAYTIWEQETANAAAKTNKDKDHEK